MDKEARTNGEQMGVRLAILFVPIVITARLLALRLPKPLAWVGSMFAWMLVIYWFPSRTEMSLRRWLIIVSVSSIIALFWAIFEPDMF